MSFSEYATVALDERVSKPLDYGIPDEMIGRLKEGTRVMVSLRGKELKATVLSVRAKTAVRGKVQPIREILTKDGTLPDDLVQLARWMARYYAAPYRKILNSMMPAAVRKDTKPKEQLFITRNTSQPKLIELAQELREKKPKQAEILDVVLRHPKGVLLSQLLEESGLTRSPIDTLIKNEILLSKKVRIDRSELMEKEFFPTKNKTLNLEQQSAFDAITQSLGTFKTHLLHGVTGSGKTEVYLQAMQQALERGMGVILLVPEIALTSQTIERLKARLQKRMAILHYRLSDGERFDAWHKIRTGEIKIVVGARSAIFSPVQNLGLIIVDEEQENSYKQSEEAPCYHARDIAVVRGKLSNCAVILGSATPSFESYHNAQNGKFSLHTLGRRATSAELPRVTIVDMKVEREKGDRPSIFSALLLRKIRDRFELGEQSLIFLNRRGTYACYHCSSCGKSQSCPHCDISLTFHKNTSKLACHLCGYQAPPSTKCMHCGEEAALQFRSPGTEQIERQLHAIFPEIRTLRMDADTTRHKGAHERLFKQFRSGKADLLIGTQMIAKGLHFPSVTLVGVINIDGSLNIPDFRAPENVFQIVTQVAGRSGRGELPGEVIIQTNMPDNPAIVHASTEDYAAFYKEEMAHRNYFKYPPYDHLARIVFTGLDEFKTLEYAEAFHKSLLGKLPADFTIYPPTPCGYARIKDNFRFGILIKGNAMYHLSQVLSSMPPPPNKIKVLFDIDPTTTYH